MQTHSNVQTTESINGLKALAASVAEERGARALPSQKAGRMWTWTWPF